MLGLQNRLSVGFLMRAFLSHSSSDKGFVEAVAEQLRPGTYELDSLTFDAGAVNSDAIVSSLRRSDLFCLFLSKASAKSQYVQFETLLGIEFLARGGINKFIAVCLDDEAFTSAIDNVKFFNIVRKGVSAESVARLIQGALITACSSQSEMAHPFIGREEELVQLERQVTDFDRPPTRALFVSGNSGAGRRTVAKKFYEDQYPEVGRIFAEIEVGPFGGIEELYRTILTSLRPSLTAAELRTRAQSFSMASTDEKRRLAADLINSLLPAREAAFLLDAGGLLGDDGALNTEIDEVVSLLEARPHPPAVFISPRMTPSRLRRQTGDVAYLGLRSLSRDATVRLVRRLLRDKSISADKDQLSELGALCDGHPYNIYRMVDDVLARGVAAFLASPSEYIDWKHRQSSEYLGKVDLRADEIRLLAALTLVPELDFESFISALSIDPEAASESLLRLSELHLLELTRDRFRIAPALRIAVERDSRIVMQADDRKRAIESLAITLSIRVEEGGASIQLANSAVIAGLASGSELSSFASALLLPSHYVWLAKRHYDEKEYDESIRLARLAVANAQRLSSSGLVAACRYQCLAASRRGNHDAFEEGITRLQTAAKDNWARSNVAYLKGFNYRFKGNLPLAEDAFREAYRLSPGNTSAGRELAAICLTRGNLEEAEVYAREAYSHAPSNPYLLDMLISVLIRRYGRDARKSSEIADMFDSLEQVGEEGGRSFYTTRRAEFEHLWGDNKKALELIQVATKRTPEIFEPKRLFVEILLKDGNRAKAFEVLNDLRDLVISNTRDRRTNYRSYVVTSSHYFQEVGRYKEAKDLFDDLSIFTAAERAAAIREIEMVQGFKGR